MKKHRGLGLHPLPPLPHHCHPYAPSSPERPLRRKLNHAIPDTIPLTFNRDRRRSPARRSFSRNCSRAPQEPSFRDPWCSAALTNCHRAPHEQFRSSGESLLVPISSKCAHSRGLRPRCHQTLTAAIFMTPSTIRLSLLALEGARRADVAISSKRNHNRPPAR